MLGTLDQCPGKPEELARIREKQKEFGDSEYRCLYEKNGDGRVLRKS